MNKIMEKPLKVIHYVSKILMVIGCVVIMFMAVLTFVDVFGRYVFNRPITGAQELTECLMAVVLYCGLPHATYNRRHVTVDAVTSKFDLKRQYILAGIASLACLFVSIPCAIKLTERTIAIWGSSKYSTAILGLKYYPFYAVAAFGNFWVSLEFLIDGIKRFVEAAGIKPGIKKIEENNTEKEESES